MTIIAYGADDVRRLERALFGEPPLAGLEASRADLSQRFLQRTEARKAAQEEAARYTVRAREKLLARMFEGDPDITHDLAKRKANAESRRQHRAPRASAAPFIKSVPRVIAGSFEWYKNPPYDVAWTSTSDASSTETAADNVGGTYSLVAQSIEGGAITAAAGIGVMFGAPAEPTTQTFAAIFSYSDSQWDNAWPWHSADTQLQTYLWVWGISENAWVGQASVAPWWNSYVTGFDGDSHNDNGFTGQLVNFPAAANQQYIAWVWSEGYVNASGGAFGGSFSSVDFNAQVQYVSFATP